MSKVLGTVGKVAGVVAGAALIASGFGAPIAIAGLGSLATVASAVSAIATTAAQLTARPPNAQGQVNERIIGANNPQPYLIGRSYSGGVQVHDVGYGGEVDDVQNPYRFIATVHSCCGPVESLEAVQFDFATIPFSGTSATGYYADYFWRDFQLGARPEADALAPQFSGTPQWGTSYKLSGFAAIGYSLEWSKRGKRFAGGQLPVIGAIWEGVMVYDPRLDSTYPGGSGTHRIDDETTWTYSRNPALHALAYSYGRYVNGVKVFGIDLGVSGIDVAKAVSWANTCDANGWTVNGVIYEPGDKWNNLKRICEAGAGEPVLDGGVLSFDFQAARTSLATVTKDDLAGGAVTSQLSKGWKTRVNTMVPRYRSEAHQWNYVQSDEVSVAAFVTADGEVKTAERQFDLVTDEDQAAQLTLYDLYQRREAGPFSVTCKPHMRDYSPGDCLTLDEELGAHPDGEIKTVVRKRSVDPTTGVVSLELELETDAKHTASLAATGTVPTAFVPPTSADLDALLYDNTLTPGYDTLRVSSSFTEGLAGNITQALDGAGAVDVTIPDHTRKYGDASEVAVTGGTITADYETEILIFYDDTALAGGAVTYQTVQPGVGGDTAGDAYFSSATPFRHFIARVTVIASDGSGGSTGGSSPPGGGGWDGTPGTSIP